MRNVMLSAAFGFLLCLLGCMGGQQTPSYQVRMSGNPAHGRELAQSYGCGACHSIAGIHTARGMVGPPLISFGRRTMVAGELPNSPENLVRWLRNPQSVNPNTAMPNLGLNDSQAHDIAAYLYTLH